MLTIASSGTRAMIFDHESLQADTYEVRVNEVSAGEIRVITSASSEPDETESFIPGFGNDAAIVSLLFVSVAVWHRIQRQESRASLRADESQLQRIFENLFENAVEHGDAETITVSTEVVQTDADLSVADDGSGLPEISNDLFDSGVTTADEGTGYGLSIVKPPTNTTGRSSQQRPPVAVSGSISTDSRACTLQLRSRRQRST